MGLLMLIKVNTFITFNPHVEEKKSYSICFTLPIWTFLIEVIFSIVSLVLEILDCCYNEKINNDGFIWGWGFLSGMALGLFIGEIFWHKLKLPFFQKYFPNEYKEYDEKVVHSRHDIDFDIEASTVENFIWPLSSLGFLIGIIIDVVP
jgi:hypothetical protein